MASVARAIEQAATRKVDADRWWDSFESLFHSLDKIGAAQNTGVPENEGSGEAGSAQSGVLDALVSRLASHRKWLLNSVAFFKPPSSTSESALSSAQIAVGDHTLEIKPEWKGVALQVSKHLVLDEVQTYILLSRVLESTTGGTVTVDNALLHNVEMFYFLERQCLLKSLRLLLAFQMAEQGVRSSFSGVVDEEVKKLLSNDLEGKLIEVLKVQLCATQPQHLEREHADLWAEEMALEQTLLLDILFLLYYEPLCPCTARRLEELLTIFQDSVFESTAGERLSVTPEAERLVKHVRHQALLILLEALDLENLLTMVHGEAPFSQGGHSITVEDLGQLDSIMAGLDFASIPDYAPLLLGWGTFICLVTILPETAGQSPIPEIDHTQYVRQAYQAGSYNFLLELLQSEPLQESDIQGSGYKNVVKTLIAALLAAYDFAGQVDSDGFDSLVDILCEVYRGQEALCLEFWDRESVIDGPIRSLLFSLREYLPFRSVPLIRLLAAQCEGTWPAECVCDFLYKLVHITCFYQPPPGSFMEDGVTVEDIVQTPTALQVPDAPGLIIPAGSSGRVLRDTSSGICLVRWECFHSGMILLLLRMLHRSTNTEDLQEVEASLKLLNRMLSSNKGLAHLLLELDNSIAATTCREKGVMESYLRIDVVGIICSVISNLVQNAGDDLLIASCLGILSTFSLCCASQVAMELSRTSLLQPSGTKISLSVGGPVLGGTLLQVLLLKTEQTVGRYPFTVAVLDLSITLLERGVLSESLASLVMNVVRNLLVNHGNWRYQQRHERWQITTKAFQMVHNILSGIIWRPEFQKFEFSVLDSVLYDVMIHDVLLQVLSIGAPALEDLHFNRSIRPKELEWLQHAIHIVLLLIHQVLLSITVSIASKDHPGLSMLWHTLFRRAAGPMPVVAAIASYLDFPRNMDLQLASAKALTSLCMSSHMARPHPISIATYILAEQRKPLRVMVAKLLSEENAYSNYPLFEAVSDLVATAIRSQPALVEFLIFPSEPSKDRSGSAGVRGPLVSSQIDMRSNIQFCPDNCEVLHALWGYLSKAATLLHSHPKILAHVLHLMASFWQGGMEYFRVIENLRTHDGFWKILAGCVSFSGSNTLLSNLIVAVDSGEHIRACMSKQETFTYAHLYRCEATVFNILAHDIFLQQHLVYLADSKSERSADVNQDKNKTNDKPFVSKESGAVDVVKQWRGLLETRNMLHAYTGTLFDKEAIQHAKDDTRVMVVGLMSKILSGNDRGLSSSLAGRIRQAAMQVFQLPPFVELLGQYSARGYSYGEQLQTMLMSDLYHHLQGDLVRRPIPAGPFRQIADYLRNNDFDVLLKPNSEQRMPYLYPAYGDSFLYNTLALESELGYEWWSQSDGPQVLPPSEAENTLRSMRHANEMAALGDAQLAALRAVSKLLTVTIFDKQLIHGGSTAKNQTWSESDLESGIEALCKDIEVAVVAVVPLGDQTGYMPSFMTAQAELLLVLVRWLCNRNAGASSTSRKQLGLCAKVIRTVVACLKLMLGFQTLCQLTKGFVTSLCSSFVLSLDRIYMFNTEEPGDQESQGAESMGDTFADVTLVGLGFLPLLCGAVENEEYVSIALAAVNLLIKGFLAPTRWFPIVQNDFPLQLALSRMRLDKGTEYLKLMLNTCLSFSYTRPGGELLVSSGIFSHLMHLSEQLRSSAASSTYIEGPFAVWHKHKRDQEGLWGLSVSVVTALLRSCASEDIAERALTYLGYEKDNMLSALCSPISSMDAQGRKKAKVQHPHTSLIALEETRRVVALLCELSNHQSLWFHFSQDSMLQYGEMTIHLLAFIAKEGFTRPGIHRGDVSVSCCPVLKEEKAAHSRPSIIGSNCAWFAVAARGSAARERSPSRASGSRSPSPTKTSSALRLSSSPSSSGILAKSYSSGGIQVPCSEYSDLVAIEVYKLAALLLRFLCKQVQQAVSRVSSGGPLDLVHFPELPAPDILHNLQDQAMSVVIDVFTNKAGRATEEQVQDFCCILLGILEKSLCLEICLWRTCNVTPLPLRSDDFSREFKALLTVVEGQKTLESSLQSLRRIISVAHPGIY